jgi:hypothetical protein
MYSEILVGSKIIIEYDDNWYDEGRVIDLIDDEVHVDFLDWIQCWKISELKQNYSFYEDFFQPLTEGICLKDFGQRC